MKTYQDSCENKIEKNDHGFRDKISVISIARCPGVSTTDVISFIDNRAKFEKQFIKASERLYSGREKISADAVRFWTECIKGKLPARRESVLIHACLCGMRLEEADGLLMTGGWKPLGTKTATDLIWRYIVGESLISLDAIQTELYSYRSELQNYVNGTSLKVSFCSASELINLRRQYEAMVGFIEDYCVKLAEAKGISLREEFVSSFVNELKSGYMSDNSIAAAGMALFMNADELRELYRTVGYDDIEESSALIMWMLNGMFPGPKLFDTYSSKEMSFEVGWGSYFKDRGIVANWLDTEAYLEDVSTTGSYENTAEGYAMLYRDELRLLRQELSAIDFLL